jgi:hypothetical protein
VSDKKGGYPKPPFRKEDNQYKTQLVIRPKGSEPARKEVKSRARWVLWYIFNKARFYKRPCRVVETN